MQDTELLKIRQAKYFSLSSKIAQLDNARLLEMFGEKSEPGGWQNNQVLEISGEKVFVKRVPLTALEAENPFSAKNHYEMPPYYNYGVGSAGFGVFRELIANIKTTNWVLSGEIEAFPLLYHYRIFPASDRGEVADEEQDRCYVEYWGGSENIGKYIQERRSSQFELALFIEHIPQVLQPWIMESPRCYQGVLDELFATFDFLRKNGIIHFDAHDENILTDGKRTYLTDFGLVLDKSFPLADAEKDFFEAHRYYDYGEAILGLIRPLYFAYEAMDATGKAKLSERYGFLVEESSRPAVRIILENLEEVHASGHLRLDEVYIACVAKYRSIVLLMDRFFMDLRRNLAKDTVFPGEELLRLLIESGAISE